MTETLFHAYTPLIVWTGLGLLIFRFLPQSFPRLLGRALYWVGVPVQLFTLARQTRLSQFQSGISFPILAPIVTVAALLLGLAIAFLTLSGLKWLAAKNINQDVQLLESSYQGSFILTSFLGNTGFVGLAIAPSFIDIHNLNWAVLYSITQNLVGTYGLGVIIASYFSHFRQKNHVWLQLRDVLTVPSLWGFTIGYFTQTIPLPKLIESGFQTALSIVIAFAFLLTGIRLAQFQGWKSFRLAIIPAILKVVLMPTLVGLATTLFLDLSGDQRLAMVVMAGMPSAFAGLILAEEYNLNRNLVASSIVVSTLLFLLVLPVWIFIFA